MESKDFGDRLRELRAARGLTQAALAERVGLHRVALAKLEAGVGKQGPTWQTVVALCQALGVTCDAFLQPPSPDLPPPAPGRPRKASSDQGGQPAGEPAPDAAGGKGRRRQSKGGGAK